MPIQSAAQPRQQGVTLVELLVALMLGLLLTAGMIQVFIGNRATYEFNDSLSRIQETARFTLDHIAYNTRMAGYSGCIADVAIHNNLDGPQNDFRDAIQDGIRGHDALGTEDDVDFSLESATSTWNPVLPQELTGEVLPGSDVLVVRSIGANTTSLVSPFTNGAQLFVDPGHGFLTGEILVASDCQKASIFQATNIDQGTSHNVVHAQSGTPGNSISVWGDEQDYGLGAELSRLDTYAFYVGQGANGRPALFQLRLNPLAGTPDGFVEEELAENVETMQVRYGVDGSNVGSVDQWVSANSVLDWQSVLGVEVSILVRASEEYGTEFDTAEYRLGATTVDPPDDRRLRQVFSTTIGVRNRLP